MKSARKGLLTGMMAGLLGLGAIGVIAYAVIAISLLLLALYGLWLAFSASIILGILVLFIQPSPLVIGAVMFFWDKNLPEMLVNWLNQ